MDVITYTIINPTLNLLNPQFLLQILSQVEMTVTKPIVCIENVVATAEH